VSPLSDEQLDLIPIGVAVHIVGDEFHPTTESAIRGAARRLNVLRRNANGQLAIPRSTLLAMRDLYRLTGWLTPRRSTLTTPWPKEIAA
jgi:hypothetical protein